MPGNLSPRVCYEKSVFITYAQIDMPKNKAGKRLTYYNI